MVWIWQQSPVFLKRGLRLGVAPPSLPWWSKEFSFLKTQFHSEQTAREAYSSVLELKREKSERERKGRRRRVKWRQRLFGACRPKSDVGGCRQRERQSVGHGCSLPFFEVTWKRQHHLLKVQRWGHKSSSQAPPTSTLTLNNWAVHA